jgi:ribonuclease HI
MEMVAALEGMKILTHPHEVHLVSDSAYLINSIKNEWYAQMARRSWEIKTEYRLVGADKISGS